MCARAVDGPIWVPVVRVCVYSEHTDAHHRGVLAGIWSDRKEEEGGGVLPRLAAPLTKDVIGFVSRRQQWK